jgi:hypothetical protein
MIFMSECKGEKASRGNSRSMAAAFGRRKPLQFCLLYPKVISKKQVLNHRRFNKEKSISVSTTITTSRTSFLKRCLADSDSKRKTEKTPTANAIMIDDGFAGSR